MTQVIIKEEYPGSNPIWTDDPLTTSINSRTIHINELRSAIESIQSYLSDNPDECTCDFYCECDDHCTCDNDCGCEGDCICEGHCICDNDCGCESYCSCNAICSCNTYSDKRLKTNIKHIGEYKGIPVFIFEWIKDVLPGLPKGRSVGFIAQDLLNRGLEKYVTTKNGYYSVMYGKLLKNL